MRSTLSRIPEIKKDYRLELEIENTVQENLINSIKPELVSWLRRELKNSKIQLALILTEKESEKVIYTDVERYRELIKKNPNLAVLKQKLKLDFGE